MERKKGSNNFKTVQPYDIVHSGELDGITNYKIFKLRYPRTQFQNIRHLTNWYIQENLEGNSICVVGIYKENVIRTSEILGIYNSRTIYTKNTIYYLDSRTEVLQHDFRNGLNKFFMNGFPHNWKEFIGRKLDEESSRGLVLENSINDFIYENEEMYGISEKQDEIENENRQDTLDLSNDENETREDIEKTINKIYLEEKKYLSKKRTKSDKTNEDVMREGYSVPQCLEIGDKLEKETIMSPLRKRRKTMKGMEKKIQDFLDESNIESESSEISFKDEREEYSDSNIENNNNDNNSNVENRNIDNNDSINSNNSDDDFATEKYYSNEDTDLKENKSLENTENMLKLESNHKNGKEYVKSSQNEDTNNSEGNGKTSNETMDSQNNDRKMENIHISSSDSETKLSFSSNSNNTTRVSSVSFKSPRKSVGKKTIKKKRPCRMPKKKKTRLPCFKK